MFVTYDCPKRSTNRHETLETYCVPSHEGHYDINFLKGQKKDFPKKNEFSPETKKIHQAVSHLSI